jgi:CDP-paratose 2-epimerase
VLWASRHLFGKSLAYMGFGGNGHQVRDLLHVADLYDLLRVQVRDIDSHRGHVYNVGGGLGCSVSLAELTAMCAARTGDVSPAITSDPKTRAADIPYYVTDNTLVTARTGWAPRRTVDDILDDVFQWLRDHRAALEPILA